MLITEIENTKHPKKKTSLVFGEKFYNNLEKS
jgi:hypothetical protein